MKRSRAALAAATLSLSTFALPVPAQAATNATTPCDSRVLRAEHQASAEFYDANQDNLECWPQDGSTEAAGDNFRLSSPTLGADTRKFYSFGRTLPRPTSVAYVDTVTRMFGGYMDGQEDDPDFNDCRNTCWQDLSYDANDYFYVDSGSGSGSTQVSLAYFESHILNTNRFSMVYSRLTSERSVFSFEAPTSTPPPPTTTAPGQPALALTRVTTSTATISWSPAASGGTPTSYTFAWRSSSGKTWSKNYPAGDSRTTSPFTLTGLAENTSYTITLTAINAAGAGPSAQTTAQTLPSTPAPPAPPPPLPGGTPPPPPAAHTPSAPYSVHAYAGRHKATITWHAPSSRGGAQINKYQVHRFGKNLFTPATRHRVVFKNLRHATYTFTVRAHNKYGWGPFSRPKTVRPHN